MPKVKAPEGYIYVIRDMDITGQYKIGKTNHPATRLYNFGVQLPIRTEVVLVKSSKNANEAEKVLHRRFRHVRQRGEWFKLSSTQLESIFDWNADAVIPASVKKKRQKAFGRKKSIKDLGWSEQDWLDTSTPETEELDEIEEDLWETNEQGWDFGDGHMPLPEGDVEETVKYEVLAGKDLSGLDLQRFDLSARDLSFANFWGAELSYTEFEASDLTAVDFTDAVLRGANLRGAILLNSNLTGAVLRGASFANANLENANLTASELTDADLLGTKFNDSTILPNGEPWTSEIDMKEFTKCPI